MSERAFPTENLCSKHRIVICPPAVLQFLAMQTIGSPRRRHEVFWRDWFLAFEPHPKLALIQSPERSYDLQEALTLTFHHPNGEFALAGELYRVELIARLDDADIFRVV